MPWQKAGDRAVSSAEDRLALVEAAVGDVPGLEASRLEIDRGGESYTADTLAELRRAGPDDELFLIVGWDVAGELTTWERHDEIQRLATLVVVNRPGAGRPPGLDDEGGGWSRSPSRTWRSPAPTCGPGPPTAGRSTTWSPRPLSAAYGPAVCTLEADDDGPLGASDRCARRRGRWRSGERLRRLRQRRRLVREELLAVAVLVLALVATLVVLGLQWLGQRSVGQRRRRGRRPPALTTSSGGLT